MSGFLSTFDAAFICCLRKKADVADTRAQITNLPRIITLQYLHVTCQTYLNTTRVTLYTLHENTDPKTLVSDLSVIFWFFSSFKTIAQTKIKRQAMNATVSECRIDAHSFFKAHRGKSMGSRLWNGSKHVNLAKRLKHAKNLFENIFFSNSCKASVGEAKGGRETPFWAGKSHI